MSASRSQKPNRRHHSYNKLFEEQPFFIKRLEHDAPSHSRHSRNDYSFENLLFKCKELEKINTMLREKLRTQEESIAEEATPLSLHSPVVKMRTRIHGKSTSLAFTLYKHELQEVKQKLFKITQEKAALESELLQNTRHTERLEAKNQQFLDELNELNRLLKTAHKENGNAQTELGEIRKELEGTERLKRTISQLCEEKMLLRNEMEGLRKRSGELPLRHVLKQTIDTDKWLLWLRNQKGVLGLIKEQKSLVRRRLEENKKLLSTIGNREGILDEYDFLHFIQCQACVIEEIVIEPQRFSGRSI